MPTYTVTNTRGSVVATIGVSTTTADQYPIELIGQGISLYGPIVASTQYRLMESFADDEFLTDSMPTTTIPEGLIQYRYDQKIPYIYDGNNWIRIATGFSSSSILYTMDPNAENFDFTSVNSQVVFAPQVVGFTYYLTGLLLIPQAVSGVTGNALFSLGTATTGTPVQDEDLLETFIIDDPSMDKHIYMPITGHVPSVKIGGTYDEVYLNVKQPVTSGTLNYDVLLFGFITE